MKHGFLQIEHFSRLEICKAMVKTLRPENNDVVILGSANNKKIAELAAKKTALQTVASHNRYF